MAVYALEVDVWNGSSVETLRFSTRTIATGGTDVPAHTIYKGLIKDAGSIRRSVSLLGRVSESRGGIVLNNADGILDPLFGYGWGRRFFLKELATADALVSSALVVASGIVVGIDAGDPFTEIRLRLRDAMDMLKTPLLVERYAGTTTGGTIHTAEGDETLKDKLKPLVLSSRASIAPDLANPFHLIYRCSTSALPLSSIVMYDGGVALEYAGDFPTLTALIAADFPSDETHQYYATCLAEGCARLDDNPVFEVRADVEYGTAADRSAARVAQRIIELLNDDGAGIVIDEDSFDDVHDFNPAEVELFVDDETTADELITRVLGWIGAGIDPGADGVIRAFVVVQEPEGVPERIYTLRDVLEGDFSFKVNPEEDGGSIPPYSTVVKYGGVQSVQSAGDLAGVVTNERRQFLAQQFQQVATPNDAAILVAYPKAVPLVLETGIRYAADALAVATAHQAFFSVRRDRNSVTVSDTIGRRALGSEQQLRIDRFGYQMGKAVRVVGRTDNFNSRRVTLEFIG